jgi:hypothetical protein
MSIIFSAEVVWAEDKTDPTHNRHSRRRNVFMRVREGGPEGSSVALFSAGIWESRRRDRIYRGAGAREGGNIILAGDGVAHL